MKNTGKEGGITLAVDDEQGQYIAKFPSLTHIGLSENEFAILALAEALGMEVPARELVDKTEFAGIPEESTPCPRARCCLSATSTVVLMADSSGRRNTLELEVAMSIRQRRSARSGRAPLPSPGRPPVAGRDEQRSFWRAIAAGQSSEDAALEAGVSQPVGTSGFERRAACDQRCSSPQQRRSPGDTCH